MRQTAQNQIVILREGGDPRVAFFMLPTNSWMVGLRRPWRWRGMLIRCSNTVMPGLDPGIHSYRQAVDPRVFARGW